MQRHLVPGVRCIWVVDVFPPKSVLIVECVSKAGRSGSGVHERECEMVLDSPESGRPSNIYNSKKKKKKKCSAAIGTELQFAVTDSGSESTEC